MDIKVYRKFSESIIQVWKSLENENDLTVFQSCLWHKNWYELIGKYQKYHLNIVLIENLNGKKIILPFGIKSIYGIKVLTFLGGNQTDYNSAIYSRGFSLQENEINWNKIKQHLDKFDIVDIKKLIKLNNYNVLFPQNLYKEKLSESSHFTYLRNSWETQKLLFKKKVIQDIARQIRRLRLIGNLEFQIIGQSDNNYENYIKTFFKQKEIRYIKTGAFNSFFDPNIKNFYKNINFRLSSSSYVHFSVLKLNDQVIATHWGAYDKKFFYYLMPTFSMEWEKYSPGKILLQYLIKWCIEKRIEVFDFTIGSENYKKEWCDNELKLNEISFSDSYKGNFYKALRYFKNLIKTFPFFVRNYKQFRKLKYLIFRNE